VARRTHRAHCVARLLGADREAIYGGTGTGLLRSGDGGRTWTVVDTGVSAAVYCVSSDRSGGILVGTAQGVLRPGADGRPWGAANDGLGHLDVYALAALPAGGLLAGTNGGGVYRSPADDPLWSPSNDGLPNPVVHDLLVHDSGDVFAASSNLVDGHKGGAVHRSLDGGASWAPVGRGSLPDEAVYALARDDTDRLYAAVRGSRVFAIDDGGPEWRDVSPGLAGTKVYGLALTAGGTVLLGTSDGAHRSTDHGATWHPASAGLADPTVYAFAADADGVVYAGTGVGVHRSTDDGLTWER
jgi:ligand-binding sensor domain-containing protein